MSYSINVTGHKDVGSRDEGEVFEQEIVSKAKDFVASLEGVTSAYGSFGHLGSVSLMPEQPEQG